MQKPELQCICKSNVHLEKHLAYSSYLVKCNICDQQYIFTEASQDTGGRQYLELLTPQLEERYKKYIQL